MKVTALANWYGSNRMLAEHVGRLLKGCSWVGVPFAGGCCELARIDARTIVANDLHRHVMNMAAVVADEALNPKLRAMLDDLPFHEEVLRDAQRRCVSREDAPPVGPDPCGWGSLQWAADFFVCSWMARNGQAGTAKEFDAPLSVRWEAGGGDSVVRFRNATGGLAEWGRVLKRCTFVCMDVFDFLDKVKDREGHGIYADPPFPGPGDRYRHTFGEATHRKLAARMADFKECRIVMRFYDHALVRELYPEGPWAWNRLVGRKQTNDDAPEVLIVRGATEAAS